MVVTSSAPTNTICSGQSVTLTATGANTYLWNTGALTPMVAVSPIQNTTLVVTGTSSLTGCPSQVSYPLTVKVSPPVLAQAYPPVVCSGKQVSLIGSGATTYVWSNGANSQNTNVSPTSSQGYTVNGTSGGCTAKATVFVQVLPLPNVSASASNQLPCLGELIQLIGTGANTYQWVSTMNSNVMIGSQPVTPVTMSGIVTFTMMGTDQAGCSKEVQLTLSVDECTGLKALSANSGDVKLYPNPSTGVFTIKADAANLRISISDVSGRIVKIAALNENRSDVNVAELANGVYYVSVTGDGLSKVLRLIKE